MYREMVVNIARSQMHGKCIVRRISLNFPFQFAATPGYTKASWSLSALCTMVQTNDRNERNDHVNNIKKQTKYLIFVIQKNTKVSCGYV